MGRGGGKGATGALRGAVDNVFLQMAPCAGKRDQVRFFGRGRILTKIPASKRKRKQEYTNALRVPRGGSGKRGGPAESELGRKEE